MAGKCPKCDNPVQNVTISEVSAGVPFGTKWKAISFNCQSCQTVLSIQIDPIAIKTDIINDLMKKLRGS